MKALLNPLKLYYGLLKLISRFISLFDDSNECSIITKHLVLQAHRFSLKFTDIFINFFVDSHLDQIVSSMSLHLNEVRFIKIVKNISIF